MFQQLKEFDGENFVCIIKCEFPNNGSKAKVAYFRNLVKDSTFLNAFQNQEKSMNIFEHSKRVQEVLRHGHQAEADPGYGHNSNPLMKDILGQKVMKAQVFRDTSTMCYTTAKMGTAKLSTKFREEVKAAKLSFKMVECGTEVSLASLEED